MSLTATDRHPRPSAALVIVRATLLGAVVMLTGCVAHATSGGLLPSPVWLGYMTLTVSMVAAVALREEVQPWQVVLLTAGGQFMVHLWLTFTAGHTHTPGQPDEHGLAMLADHGPMMLAHLLAAAAVGWWLGQGERALWTLLAVAWRLLLVPTFREVAHRPARKRPAAPSAQPTPLRSALLRPCLTTRGPPQRCA